MIHLYTLLFEEAQNLLTAGDTITEDEAKHWFKYFHLSPTEYTDTFNPRIPTNTKMATDVNGDIIEDDFTRRISLAPSIMAARASGARGRYVYACDVREVRTDDIDVIELSDYKEKCPIDYPKKGMKTGNTFKDILHNLVAWTKNLPEEEAYKPDLWKTALDPKKYRSGAPLSPDMLQQSYKTQFKYCVPTMTKEKWAEQPLPNISELGNVGFVFLGTIAGGKRGNNPITLSAIGASFINTLRGQYGGEHKVAQTSVNILFGPNQKRFKHIMRNVQADIEYFNKKPLYASVALYSTKYKVRLYPKEAVATGTLYQSNPRYDNGRREFFAVQYIQPLLT